MVTSEAIRKELEAIKKANGGALRPADVVEFAKDPTTALHSKFDWEDSEAAHKWRLHQARNVIHLQITYIKTDDSDSGRVIEVTRKNMKAEDLKKIIRVGAFSRPQAEWQKPNAGYGSTVDDLNDPVRRTMLIQDALSDLRRVQRNYEALRRLRPVWKVVDKIEAEVTAELAKAERKAARKAKSVKRTEKAAA